MIKKILFVLLLAIVFFGFSGLKTVSAATATTSVDIFLASTTWTAPTGVVSTTVECWGGGGAGGGSISDPNRGGGGGGGAYSTKSGISVTPGNSYTVTVGTGGTGVSGGNGNNGNDSYFIDISTVLAKGGNGGKSDTNGSTGGVGANSADGVGDIKYSGGNGGNEDNTYGRGGGGGGGAGNANNGSAPSPTQLYTGGVGGSVGGGNGGDGNGADQNGSIGNTNSGGGGGGGEKLSVNTTGGSGANGQCKITYTATLPTYVGKGTFNSGNGAITLTTPTGYAKDDVLFIIVESENENITTPTDWTDAPGSPQGTGTAKATGAVRLEVFYRLATSTTSVGNTTIADSGDHTAGIMFAIRGLSTSTPIGNSAGRVDSGATASIVFPNVTTTINDSFILNLIGLDKDGADSDTMQNGANGNLANFTEQHDQTISTGDGGGVGFFTGRLSTAGATGSSTATGDSSTTHAYVTLALNPEKSPTVVLNSPADASSDSDTTPTLNFTGTDPNSDKIEYNVQVDTTSTFDSTVSNPLVDSWSESYQDATSQLGASITEMGQSFANTNAGKLTSVKFYLQKGATPDTITVARLYAQTGTYGSSNDMGTGSVLATSDPINSTDLPVSLELVTFTFTGSQQYSMLANMKYVITVYANDGVGEVIIGRNGTAPGHGGSVSYINTGVWINLNTSDLPFYVYNNSPYVPLLNKFSATDTGFTAGHPFNSGSSTDYTTTELPENTYYWRVAGIDAGSNTYGDWSPTRSFTITSGVPPALVVVQKRILILDN